MMTYQEGIVDVTINDVSLLSEYVCMLSVVTITPLIKKQYLVDIPGTDGARDLTDWFGSPRFEARTLTIRTQCCREGAADCAARLSNAFGGRTVAVRMTSDPGVYRTGIVTQVSATGPQMSDDVILTICCDPCRYADEETVQAAAASDTAVSYVWGNNGNRPVVPEIVSESDTVIAMGTSKWALTKGTYRLPGLAIPGGSSITVQVSGGPLIARYREAIL